MIIYAIGEKEVKGWRCIKALTGEPEKVAEWLTEYKAVNVFSDEKLRNGVYASAERNVNLVNRLIQDRREDEAKRQLRLGINAKDYGPTRAFLKYCKNLEAERKQCTK